MDGTFVADSTKIIINSLDFNQVLYLLMGYGPYGTIAAILLYVVKKWAWPELKGSYISIRNGWNDVKAMFAEISTTIADVRTSMSEVRITCAEINTNTKSTAKKVDVLSDNHQWGSVDQEFGYYIFNGVVEKMFMKAIVYLNMRIEENHVIGNEHTVLRRYQNRAESETTHNVSLLRKWTCDGVYLDSFFATRDDALVLINAIYHELYLIQLRKAKGENIAQQDIQAACDRWISRLNGAFKRWLMDKTQHFDIKTEYLELFPPIQEKIEMLQEKPYNYH